jgi:hypothetical protein
LPNFQESNNVAAPSCERITHQYKSKSKSRQAERCPQFHSTLCRAVATLD